ncbi:MAG: cell wall biosynthesis glycosyltransferase [Propionibacteriaceae bacterium]|jgi:glycosyltransferase involved in cell wall biosynthesis|nr:cell wall biosynthesis glycosyltransferase [Propionibacteriaceae bacterium]
MVKVSVVVPVYNPGEYVRACVAGLLSQTLPATEFEAIFVDDGSTDTSPAYLDAVAAEHPNIRVIHQPNSGWPGQPRNVGIEAAVGEFVFFCDHDDWLGEEALQRMYDFAVATESDIVIGKMAGIRRGVPEVLFASTRSGVSVADAPVMDSLTPHKLFRRSFLNRHQIRFPEGKRRLEDHLFVVTAYLSTDRIGIYSDYTCYYHIRREDVANAAFSQISWPSYFQNLEEAIEVVVERTEPGPLRDQIFKRWLLVEMVGRLRGKHFTKLDPDSRKEIFEAAHGTASKYFGDGVAALLPLLPRIVGRAIISGDFDALSRLAEQEARWHGRGALTAAGWVGRRLQVSGAVEFFDREAADPAVQRFTDLVGELPAEELTSELAKLRLSVRLTERGSGQTWTVPAVTRRLGLATAFTATIDITTAAGGGPLPAGIWDIGTELVGFGLRIRQKPALVRPLSQKPPVLRRSPAGEPEVALYVVKKVHSAALDIGLVLHPELSRRGEPTATDRRGRARRAVGRFGRSVSRRFGL